MSFENEQDELARKKMLRKLRKEESVVKEKLPSHARAQFERGNFDVDAMQASHASQAAPQLKPVQLGNLTINQPVILSPMAGVTNWPFRVLCEEYGGDGLYVDEMITARALVANNDKAWRLATFAPSEKVRSLQLYGVNPDWVEKAVQLVIDKVHPDHIDLNYGCPVPKITRHGGGSALPWKQDLFREDIRRVVKACEPEGIPVTAKIRVGIDADHLTFMQAGHIAQEEGAAAVTLHARTTAEYYGGHSNWDDIAALKQELSIPVFGNGDIFSAQDALDMVSYTGCDGVAIGRGCQGRPWLFEDIRRAFAGSDERVNPNLGYVVNVIKRHVQMLVKFYNGDESMAVRDIRKHIAWYFKGYAVGSAVRVNLMKCENVAQLNAVLDELDPSIEMAEQLKDAPRGRIRYQKKVHLPQGWLDSRFTTKQEREILFGEDPLDASY